jgi:hypothetical protein
MTPFGENRGGTPSGELLLSKGGRAASQDAEVVEQRLPAFRILYLFVARIERSEIRGLS